MHDVGSPCLTPLVTLKDSLATPFNMTDVLAIRYKAFIILIVLVHENIISQGFPTDTMC